MLCFGKRVSEEFRARVIKIARMLGTDPNWIMAVMAFETGETFRADVRNAAGSGAVGLIQFMPQTAAALGTTTEELAKMDPEEQLGFVLKYLFPFRGQLGSIEDVYMAVLWPSAVGKPNDAVLFRRSDSKHPKRFIQNRGLDWDRDGLITKEEASGAVRRKLLKGMSHCAGILQSGDGQAGHGDER